MAPRCVCEVHITCHLSWASREGITNSLFPCPQHGRLHNQYCADGTIKSTQLIWLRLRMLPHATKNCEPQRLRAPQNNVHSKSTEWNIVNGYAYQPWFVKLLIITNLHVTLFQVTTHHSYDLHWREFDLICNNCDRSWWGMCWPKWHHLSFVRLSVHMMVHLVCTHQISLVGGISHFKSIFYTFLVV